MAGFLKWVAPRYESIQKELSKMVREWSTLLDNGGHKRTPEIFANLLAGLHFLLEFAVDAGAITDDERNRMTMEYRSALFELAPAQHEHHDHEKPATRFIDLLRSALTSGEAHVANMDGEAPDEEVRRALGWKSREIFDKWGTHSRTDWDSQGRRVGWADNEYFYLDPESAYKAVQAMASGQRQPLATSQRMLCKHLDEAYLIQRKTKGYQYRTRIDGALRYVICLSMDVITGEETENPL